MNYKRIDFSQPAGFPLHTGVLDFMQSAYGDAIKGLANMAGNMVIVSGMVEVGNNVSAGWIVLNGELIPFQAGAKQNTFVVEDASTSARFQDGTDKTVFFTKVARFGSGVTQWAYADLKRIGSNSIMQDTETFATSRALRRLAELSIYESNVVVSGCEVSDVDDVAQTCTISAGKVILGEQYFVTAQYTGAFPVWINASGMFVTADPGGENVKFDPHTSQRKADVLRRGLHASGEIVMSKVVSDRFDPLTGIGKWEWLGWKLCAETMGRSPVGLWFGEVNGDESVYDDAYRDMLSVRGANVKQITKSNLPAYDLETETIGDNGWPEGSGNRNTVPTNSLYLLSPTTPNKRDKKLKVPSGGGNQPFDVRQAVVVLAFIERI